MIEVTRYELEVFKERVLELCRDMGLTLMVDGFDFQFAIRRGFDITATTTSLDNLARGSNDYNQVD